MNQTTGEIRIKAELMRHNEEILHQIDLIIFNNVTRNQADSFTIALDVLEEKLVPSGFVFTPDLEPKEEQNKQENKEEVKVDLSEFD